MLNYNKLTGKLMNVNDYIYEHSLKPVTSFQIYETGSATFHPEGLFSEAIFGSLISEDRIAKIGYIDLNCEIIEPIIYNAIARLSKFYIEILNSRTYAIYNEKTNIFERVNEEDKGANTGYQFFISKIATVKILRSTAETSSSIRDVYQDVFEKHQKQGKLTTKQLLVIPAGLREIAKDTKKMEKDSINKMYVNVLSLANSIPPRLRNNPIYDRSKQMIQAKILEIFNYITDMYQGDKGFFIDKYANRNVAFGTRNVLSIDIKSAISADDPTNLNPNDAGISLYQALKAFQLLIIYHYKNYMSNIINVATKAANVTDKKTLKQSTIFLSSRDIDKYTHNDKIEKLINDMRYDSFRNSPFTIKSMDNKEHYIILKYDLDNVIFWASNITELTALLKDNYNIDIDMSRIEPITWFEFFYFIVFTSVEVPNSTGCATRYPAIQPESTKPLLTKVYTTSTSRKVTLIVKGNTTLELPRYPVTNTKAFETMVTNSLIMKGQSSDTDGDMLSFTGTLTKDGNEEIVDHFDSSNSILQNSGEFQLIPEGNTLQVIAALSQ